jgi:thiamine biosynthesis protein ThiS
MSKITITLNGEKRDIKKDSTISSLINDLGLDTKKIAIERNLEIISVGDFDKTIILEADKIEIVHFIGGG